MDHFYTPNLKEKSPYFLSSVSISSESDIPFIYIPNPPPPPSLPKGKKKQVSRKISPSHSPRQGYIRHGLLFKNPESRVTAICLPYSIKRTGEETDRIFGLPGSKTPARIAVRSDSWGLGWSHGVMMMRSRDGLARFRSCSFESIYGRRLVGDKRGLSTGIMIHIRLGL